MKKILCFLLVNIMSTSLSFAITILDQKLVTFNNIDCEKNSTCDLERITFDRVHYKVDFSQGEYNLGTRLISKYKTKNLSSLKDYAFVQYIKGCQFNSRMVEDENGVPHEERNRTIDINSFGELIPYHFPEWTVDSVDVDPVYNSGDTKEERHNPYRWNKVIGSTDYSTELFYGEATPTNNELYVIDRPGTAFTQYDTTNISLQYKICLYKADEIPLVVTKDQGFFPNPIFCYDWNSSFIYDFKTMKFNSPSEIDPYCK